MIHVKAIIVGLIVLTAALGLGLGLAFYPLIVGTVLGIGCAYCFGRAVLELISR